MQINEIGISPSSLEIEVTENMIMDDPENTLRILYSLKDLGVQIAIDDFGTGYWSLNNLDDCLLIKSKSTNHSSNKSLSMKPLLSSHAIIAMANKLGIKSIAEGVETREQYEFLAREGCTEIQGYYFTQPLTEEAMSFYLKHPVPIVDEIQKGSVIVPTES